MRLRELIHLLLSPFLTRRVHPRVVAHLPVDWHVFGCALGHRSATEDLSTTGARVSSLGPAPVGSPLVLGLTTPNGPVEAHGRVVWTTAVRMGVRFSRPIPGLMSLR